MAKKKKAVPKPVKTLVALPQAPAPVPFTSQAPGKMAVWATLLLSLGLMLYTVQAGLFTPWFQIQKDRLAGMEKRLQDIRQTRQELPMMMKHLDSHFENLSSGQLAA